MVIDLAVGLNTSGSPPSTETDTPRSMREAIACNSTACVVCGSESTPSLNLNVACRASVTREGATAMWGTSNAATASEGGSAGISSPSCHPGADAMPAMAWADVETPGTTR